MNAFFNTSSYYCEKFKNRNFFNFSVDNYTPVRVKKSLILIGAAAVFGFFLGGAFYKFIDSLTYDDSKINVNTNNIKLLQKQMDQMINTQNFKDMYVSLKIKNKQIIFKDYK